MPTSLEYLKATGTVIVCDTGDFNAIKTYQPQDATTNPSLILAAAKKPEYSYLIDLAVAYGISSEDKINNQVQAAFDRLLVEFGRQILNVVPGRVSTEIDARYSFDTIASVRKAKELIKLYESIRVDTSRILIKLAATWEGIKAAETLQREGINCNLTLVFSLVQAVAAAEAQTFLISPFVGRIMDWHKAQTGKSYAGVEDPGVLAVSSIFHYYKQHDYKTIVMGASFRNIDEIVQLAGCDFLTVSPDLLAQLSNSREPVEKKLFAENFRNSCSAGSPTKQLSYLKDEAKFRFDFNEDAMAVAKLREGISKFSADAVVLKEMLKGRIIGQRGYERT